MSDRVLRRLRRRAVYYVGHRLPLAFAAALLASAVAVPAPAQIELTVEPAMVKGPPTAPVTIVEFSDYQ